MVAGVVTVVLLATASAPGCRRDLPVAPRDEAPPAIEVVFPNPDSAAYDRDSDGLVDLELRWRDSAGAVHPATLRIAAIQGGVPGVPADSNLLPGWRIVRLDTTGADVEETVGELLRAGDTRLAISVADTAGNVATDTTPVIHLPAGAYHGAINLKGMPSCQLERGVNLALSPDGQKGFVSYNGCVAVFDPDGVQPVHFVPVPFAGFGADISVDSATGLAYIGGGPNGGVSVLDTRAEQVLQSWADPMGAAWVHFAAGRLYVGQSCTDGSIDVLDASSFALLGTIRVGAPYLNSECPNVDDIAISRDGRTGWAAVINTGIVVFDPQTYEMRSLMRLGSGGCGGECWENARSIRLVGDRWLELAELSIGLFEYDTQPWGLRDSTGNVNAASPNFAELALSPDGTSLFVSAKLGGFTYRGDSIQTPYLFDVPGLHLRYAFPHRLGGITDAAIWDPDGKRVFMMEEFQVDVYLVRPRPG